MKLLPKILIKILLIIIITSTSTTAAKLPYPLIFIHGITGSDKTFQITMEYLRDNYNLGPINVFDIVLNADNDKSKSNIETDVKWEDFTLNNYYFNLGRRSFAEDIENFSDGWSLNDLSNIYAINFKEERIRGNEGINNYFDQSNQAGIFKQGKALSVMINEVLNFTSAKKVILVGHSMGGLAIREYLQRKDDKGKRRWWVDPDTENGHKVARVVTIGTPHLGSNSWVDPTRLRRAARSGITDLNGTSEALRDLKYSYDSYTNCDDQNPVGIYLFGGNEHCIAGKSFNKTFNNVDINCNGSENDDIIGLNKGTTYNPEMSLPLNIYYTWIISNSNGGELFYCAKVDCDDEPPGDGAVLYEKQWLYENNTSVPAGKSYMMSINTKHTEEAQNYQAIIQALDEPNDTNLAYEINLGETITGFINIQADNESDDHDIFKISNPAPAHLAIYYVKINCSNNIVYELSAIDPSYNILTGNSIYTFPYDLSFYISPSFSHFYIKISGKPFKESYKYPYTIHISRDYLAMKADFSADKTNGNAPLTVNFSDKSTAKHTNISSWQWNFGDGTTSNEQNPQHIYSNPGIYKVSLVVGDEQDMQDTEEKYNYIVVSSDVENTSNINIVTIEYFFDTDPGYGNGLSIPITPANTIDIKTTLDVSHLEPGLHRLYVRAKDEEGQWGIVQSRPVLVTKHSEIDNSGISYLSNITDVEYFFDNAQEFGKGKSFSFAASSEISLTKTIDVSNLDPGLHRLYIRAKDETGTWGIVQSRPVLITQHNQIDDNKPEFLSKITAIEYFFDNAPGFGKGNSFSISANSELSITETIDVSSLDPGLHRVYIRAQDETGTWGIVQSRPVLITLHDTIDNQGPQYFSKVTNMEYFFDECPGFGNGTSLSFSSYSEVQINQNIDVSQLSTGLHRIYVRAQDESGQWGIVQSRPVLITPKSQSIGDHLPYYSKITEVEYFFDTAPEFGHGIGFSFTPYTQVSLSKTIDVSSLSPGLHRIYVRAKDETGTWGIVQSRPLLIEAVDESLPDIVRIEYFFNNDPGQNSGISLPFEPSSYVSINTNVHISHLNKGDHKIYARAKDENGNWSQTRSSNFTIIDSPPLIVNHIQDIEVLKNAQRQIIDLSQIFYDPDNDNGSMNISVSVNTNPELVTVSISDNMLNIDYKPEQTGEATITLLAESFEKTVTHGFKIIVKSIDINLIAMNGHTGNVINNSTIEIAPLKVKFNVTGLSAKKYKWDFNNDNIVDRTTYDNNLTYYFDKEGVYTIKVTAIYFDDLEYDTTASFSIKPSYIIDESISFVPYYPENNNIPSKVMVGGKAIRWYRIYNNENEIITNKKLFYTFDNKDTSFESEVDNSGYVRIETPETFENTQYGIDLITKNNEHISMESDIKPEFHVYVIDREFKEEYTFLFGLSGGFDVGFGVSLGPINIKLLTLGLYGGINISSMMGLETIGDKTDLIIGNSFGTQIEADVSPKIFKKSWQDVKAKPKAELGFGFDGQYKHTLKSSYRVPDFFNQSDKENYNKNLIVAAAIFLEPLISAQAKIAGLDRIMSTILYEIIEIDEYKESIASETCISGNANVGFNLELTNPLSNISGNKLGVELSVFNKQFLHELTEEKKTSGNSKITQKISSDFNVYELDVMLSKKFAGDKRKKDTPEYKINPFSKNTPIFEGEKYISVEFNPFGQPNLEYGQLQDRDTDYGFFNKKVQESYYILSTDNQSIINNIAEQSNLINKMLMGIDITISKEEYTNAFESMISINHGEIIWNQEAREVNHVTIPFDLEFGIGLGAKMSVGLHLQIDVFTILEYMSKKGVISSEKGNLQTSEYYKDDWITNNIKGPKAVVDQYIQALKPIIEKVFETVHKTIEAGKEAIVNTGKAIAEGGAKVKAAASNIYEKYKLCLSKLSPNRKTYRVRARRLNKSTTYFASTVGEVYIINLQDENGNNLEYFSDPLELTIGFTNELLNASGFSTDHARKLKIYRWDGQLDCYVYMGGSVDLNNQSVTCFINFPGQYILAIDETAPEITGFKTSDHSPTPVIKCNIIDSLSGIDISTFNFNLDGLEYINSENYTDYFNPENGLMSYQVVKPLAKGIHTITLTAGDTSGNVQVSSYTFTVNDIPPIIEYSPLTQTISAGESITITAYVSDDEDIKNVFLYYRAKTDEMNYMVIQMTGNESSIYSGVISKKYATGYGLNYYIKAADTSGNETETDISEIKIEDNAGPVLTNSISAKPLSDQILIQFNKSDDVDLSEYRLYIGSAKDDLELYQELGNTNWCYIDKIQNEKYLEIEAIDDFNNTGNRISYIIQKPVISSIPNMTILEDAESIPVHFSVTDMVNTESQITVLANTSNLSMIYADLKQITQTASEYLLSITPVSDVCGVETLTIIATNGILTETASFQLTITCINIDKDEPPYVLNEINDFEVNEDAPIKQIDLSDVFFDPENDNMNFVIKSNTNPELITATIDNELLFLEFQAEQHGIAEITIFAISNEYSVTDEFTIKVKSVNDLPVIYDHSFIIEENCQNGYDVGILQVYDNDIEDILSFSIVSENENNPFIVNERGYISANIPCSLNFESISSYSLTVKVSDGYTFSSSNVFIKIIDINEVPEITNQSFDIEENMAIGSIVNNVNALDPENHALIFSIIKGNIENAFSINEKSGEIIINNQINYEKNSEYELQIAVMDDKYTKTAIINISVTDINEAPVAKNQKYETQDKSIIISTLEATDEDGDSLLYSIIQKPSRGELTILDKASGDFSYSPFINSSGKDYFIFKANDESIDSEPAKVTIEISDVTSPNIVGICDDYTPKQSKTWVWGSNEPAKFIYEINHEKDWKLEGDFTDVKTATTIQKDGTVYIHVQAKDQSNNLSDIITAYAIIDNTPPEAIISGIPASSTNLTQVILEVQGEDIFAYKYILNDNSISEAIMKSQPILLDSLSEGKYFISVIARDIAGNWQSTDKATTGSWEINHVLMGDINDNGTLDLKDAILPVFVAAGINPYTTDISPYTNIYYQADINDDKKIDLAEAIYGIRRESGQFKKLSMVIYDEKIVEGMNNECKGTLFINSKADKDLKIAVYSSNEDEISLPKISTILKGKDSSDFYFYVIDDNKIDGPQEVIIYARLSGQKEAKHTITVNDNEKKELILELPDNIEKGSTEQGKVIIPGVIDDDLIVNIACSNTKYIDLIDSVIITKGIIDTSFPINVIYDEFYDSKQVNITVSSEDWISATEKINVKGKLEKNLKIEVNKKEIVLNQNSENLEINDFTKVSILEASDSDIHINLNHDLDSIIFQSPIKILAGNNFTSFSIKIIESNVIGDQNISITASSPGWKSSSDEVLIKDERKKINIKLPPKISIDSAPATRFCLVSLPTTVNYQIPLEIGTVPQNAIIFTKKYYINPGNKEINVSLEPNPAFAGMGEQKVYIKIFSPGWTPALDSILIQY